MSILFQIFWEWPQGSQPQNHATLCAMGVWVTIDLEKLEVENELKMKEKEEPLCNCITPENDSKIYASTIFLHKNANWIHVGTHSRKS